MAGGQHPGPSTLVTKQVLRSAALPWELGRLLGKFIITITLSPAKEKHNTVLSGILEEKITKAVGGSHDCPSFQPE